MQALISYTRQVICRDLPQDVQALVEDCQKTGLQKTLHAGRAFTITKCCQQTSWNEVAPKFTMSKNLRPHRVKHQVNQSPVFLLLPL